MASNIESQNVQNLKIAQIIEENEIITNLNSCPTLTINILNKNNIRLLPIPDNNNPVEQTLRDKVTTNYKSNVVYRILRPEDLDLKVPTLSIQKPAKRTKQKKAILKEEIEDNETIEFPKKICRTRSGRMSKPPRHIRQEDSPSLIAKSNSSEEKSETTISSSSLPQPIIEKTENKVLPLIEPKKTEQKRKLSSQYRCKTCNKAYLGKNKMIKHLHLNPGHVAPDFNKKSSQLNLWPELLRRTKDLPRSQQSQIFCRELINLIYKAKSVVPKLIKPALEENDSNFKVDSFISTALGIPEGNYSFNETVSVQEASEDNENTDNSIEIKETEQSQKSEDIDSNDQNSLIYLLDTGQVAFDSSSNSEEIMCINQLVNERLKTLAEEELEPLNSTPNLSLDLSLDMFSYHDP